jgi:Arc/MetJ family transcription regulator
MSRTNIDLDDDACRAVMDRYGFTTKRGAVNFALRSVAVERLGLDEAKAMRGAGWEGEVEELRGSRAS